MKAYRFEGREERKWQWGFWAFYYFTVLVSVVLGSVLEKPLLTGIMCGFCILIYLIINVDLVGYKIRRKK